MSNFQSIISFSNNISEKRINKAKEFLGEKTVKRIIAVSLFLLGGKREHISSFLNMPIGTLFSLLNRFQKSGTNAFIHQNKKQIIKSKENDLTTANDKNDQTKIEIIYGDQKESLTFALDANNKITINSSNSIQFKTLILTFMNSGFITLKKASEILNMSDRHLRTLNIKLQHDDVPSLIDKRQGQKIDYSVTKELKTELIQQYTANIISGKSTSSIEITKQLNESCHCNISDRTVRHHISNLGLDSIKKTLPKLITDFKKNSKI